MQRLFAFTEKIDVILELNNSEYEHKWKWQNEFYIEEWKLKSNSGGHGWMNFVIAIGIIIDLIHYICH